MIKIPARITNPEAYRRGAINNMKRNAAITAKKKWLFHNSDGQQIYDWLTASGEYANWWEIDGRKVEDHELCDDGCPDNQDAKYITHPMIDKKPYGSFGEFLGSMHDQLVTYGQLSPKQTDSVRKAIARTEKYVAEAHQRKLKYAAEAAKSKWVGEVGDRIMFDVKLVKVLSFEGIYGWSYINIMRDVDGNAIIGKGSKRYGVEGTFITFKATIKDHATRDGAKQTIVNRPFFKKG